MGVSKNLILLVAAGITGAVLFISYTLDLDSDYDAAGDMAFVAIPSIMVVMGTFWATSEIYASNSSNTMKMRGVSVFLTVLLGAYLAYLIVAYKDSAKNPIIIPGHGTRSVQSGIDTFEFFMDVRVNFRDDDDAAFTTTQFAEVEAACDLHNTAPTKDTLGDCSFFRIDSSLTGCEIQADGKTVSGCFSTLNDIPLTAEFEVKKPTKVDYSTAGRIKTVVQQLNVKFNTVEFAKLITQANCWEVKYSADTECAFGFTLPWTFQSSGKAVLDYKSNNYKKAPTSVQIILNNAYATDSSAVSSTGFDVYFVNGKRGLKKTTFFMTDWTANIDLKGKETLTWKPRRFRESTERDRDDISWSVDLGFVTKKSDLTLPVEVREESVRLPFFTIFTALMAFLTPLGAIFGFFYPNIFPKRYAAFGTRPAFFDQLDKDAGGASEVGLE